MNPRILLLPLLLLAIPASALAASCEQEEHRGFDFWLGVWEIEQRFRGDDDRWITLPARTTVTSVLDGCALLERWQGDVQFTWAGMTEPRRLEGLSVRSWLPGEKVWRIQWMDSMRPALSDGHYGTIKDGHGVFEPRERPDTGWSRIVFDRESPDRVMWRLDTTRDGTTWVTRWTMDMRRAETVDQRSTEAAAPGSATDRDGDLDP